MLHGRSTAESRSSVNKAHTSLRQGKIVNKLFVETDCISNVFHCNNTDAKSTNGHAEQVKTNAVLDLTLRMNY